MAHSMHHLDLPAHYTVEAGPPPTLFVPPELGHVFQRAGLSEDLTAIERLLLRRTGSRSPLLASAGTHAVAAGGKRLRAALVLLAAHLGSYDRERASHPAAAVELLHAASLVHDDLVDHA